MALQPNALRTYHVLWAIDPRDPEEFAQICLPYTGYDGLHTEIWDLGTFAKKVVWVYCNCKSTTLNVVEVANIDLKVYKPYTFGNGEFVNAKKKDLVRLYGEDPEHPDEFRIVPYAEFRRVGGKIRKASWRAQHTGMSATYNCQRSPQSVASCSATPSAL